MHEKKARIHKRPAGRGAKIADDGDDDDDTEKIQKNQGDVSGQPHGPQPQEDGGKDEDGDSSAQADDGSQLDGAGTSDVASNASTGGF